MKRETTQLLIFLLIIGAIFTPLIRQWIVRIQKRRREMVQVDDTFSAHVWFGADEHAEYSTLRKPVLGEIQRLHHQGQLLFVGRIMGWKLHMKIQGGRIVTQYDVWLGPIGPPSVADLLQELKR